MAKPRSASARRVLKTKWFTKAARNSQISDEELCDAIDEIARGQGSDLGGGVWKKRLGDNRHRSIILAKNPRFWVYQFLFAKADSDNVSAPGLAALRRIAAEYEDTLTDPQVARLIKDQGWKEVCNAKDDEA